MSIGVFNFGWAATMDRLPLLAVCAALALILAFAAARARRRGFALFILRLVMIVICASLGGLAAMLLYEWSDAGRACAAPFRAAAPCGFGEFALNPLRALPLVSFDTPVAVFASLLAGLCGLWILGARRANGSSGR